jgi:hypothetical protein
MHIVVDASPFQMSKSISDSEQLRLLTLVGLVGAAEATAT